MEDGETKLCTNCDRQIPSPNYNIHTIHCSRHIKVCQKCKEPVPASDMKKHLQDVPCKQCGERMQACDLLPHQHEACPQTSIMCSYCTIQLARNLMKDHEDYCGTRTERCEECREHVMIKYQKLHEESNHTFLKLNDEPGPSPSWETPAQLSNSKLDKPAVSVTPAIKPYNVTPPSSSQTARNQFFNPSSSISSDSLGNSSGNWQTNLQTTSESAKNIPRRDQNLNRNIPTGILINTEDTSFTDSAISDVNCVNSQVLREKMKKRQIEMSDIPRNSCPSGPVQSSSNGPIAKDTIKSNGRVLKGAMKKYPAPQPPNVKKAKESNDKINNKSSTEPSLNIVSTSFKHIRDVPMYAATMREQEQIREREHQTEINLAQGLPPVLNPAQKLEKLRKMSALQNMEFDSESAFRKKPIAKKNVNKQGNDLTFTPMTETDLLNRLQRQNINSDAGPARNINLNRQNSEEKNVSVRNLSNVDDHYYEPIENVLRNPSLNSRVQTDRFTEIKNDLRVLRKELKKCSSPLETRRSSDVGDTQTSPTLQQAPVNSQNSWRVLRDHNAGSAASNNQRNLTTRTNMQENVSHENVGAKVKNQKRKQEENHSQRVLQNVDEGLPCQFCNKTVPSIEIQDHEIYCQIRMRRRQEEEQPNLSPAVIHSLRKSQKKNNAFIATGSMESRLHNGIPFSNPPRNHLAEEYLDTPADFIGVTFPCEFCLQSIPAHMFVAHETGCNPLATSILPPTANMRPQQEVTPPSTPIPKNTNVPSNKVPENPRANVRRKNSNKSKNRNNVQHTVNRYDAADEINAEGAFGFGEEVQIPCEFCMTLMSANMLMSHQEECERNS